MHIIIIQSIDLFCIMFFPSDLTLRNEHTRICIKDVQGVCALCCNYYVMNAADKILT